MEVVLPVPLCPLCLRPVETRRHAGMLLLRLRLCGCLHAGMRASAAWSGVSGQLRNACGGWLGSADEA